MLPATGGRFEVFALQADLTAYVENFRRCGGGGDVGDGVDAGAQSSAARLQS